MSRWPSVSDGGSPLVSRGIFSGHLGCLDVAHQLPKLMVYLTEYDRKQNATKQILASCVRVTHMGRKPKFKLRHYFCSATRHADLMPVKSPRSKIEIVPDQRILIRRR